MTALIKEFETLYEDMSEARAEGNTSGYTQKVAGLQSDYAYV